MNVVNCKNCGRLFNAITRKKLCPNCMNQLEDKFQEVKEYINRNPNANIDSVSKDCEISVKQIKEWVREERLAFREGSADGIECEKCGAMILTGRYCEQCKQKMHTNLSHGINPRVEPPRKRERDRDKDRMRFLQNL